MPYEDVKDHHRELQYLEDQGSNKAHFAEQHRKADNAHVRQ